jgi:predicted DNA-binding transcriptional regulator AlpA
MELNLSSLDRAPKAIPVWDLIVEDLGNPPATGIAKALGVSRSTVYRWQAEGGGPRIACMALFWLTRWGRSEINTQAVNDATLAATLARSLSQERQQLLRQVDELDRENRDLNWLLATERRSALARGSAATVAAIRTDTGPEDAWAGASSPPAWWPALEAPTGPGPEPGPAGPDDAHPGSPAAPPPGARSARCPAPGRSALPQPSSPPEASPSSPSSPPWCQGDAILASGAEPSRETCFRWNKPRAAPPAAALRASGGVTSRHPAQLAPAAPVPGAAPGGSHGAQTPDQAAQHSARGVAAQDADSRSAGGSMAGRSPPARAPAGGSQLRGLDGPSHGAAPHTPAPRAPSPPGAAVFAAIVTSTLKTRP